MVLFTSFLVQCAHYKFLLRVPINCFTTCPYYRSPEHQSNWAPITFMLCSANTRKGNLTTFLDK